MKIFDFYLHFLKIVCQIFRHPDENRAEREPYKNHRFEKRESPSGAEYAITKPGGHFGAVGESWRLSLAGQGGLPLENRPERGFQTDSLLFGQVKTHRPDVVAGKRRRSSHCFGILRQFLPVAGDFEQGDHRNEACFGGFLYGRRGNSEGQGSFGFSGIAVRREIRAVVVSFQLSVSQSKHGCRPSINSGTAGLLSLSKHSPKQFLEFYRHWLKRFCCRDNR